jgi:hypothetical protein
MKRMSKQLLFYFLFCFSYAVNAMLTPSPILPQNNSQVFGFTVNLEVSHIGNPPAGYQYWIDTTANFSSNFYSIETTVNKTVSTRALKLGRNYYWKVRAFNVGDTSAWSNVSAFTVPSTFATQLISPANNTVGPIVNLICKVFNDLDFGGGVQFEYDTLSNFSSLNRKLMLSATAQFNDTSFFNFGKRIFWRARVYNVYGDTLDWSATWSYTFHAMPTINGSSGITTVNPMFLPSWANAGLSKIEIQVDTVTQFNSASLIDRALEAGRTFDTLSNLYFGQKYFYRIRLKYGLNQTPWSVTRQIMVKQNGSIIGQASFDTVVLNCEDMNGANYHFELYENSGQYSLIKDTMVSKNMVSIIYPFEFGKSYKWRVRYFHVLDTTLWLETIFNYQEGKLTLISPHNYQSNIEVNPILMFQKVNWASSYVLEIDKGIGPDFDFEANPSSSYIKVVDNFKEYSGSRLGFDTALLYGQSYVWQAYAYKGSMKAFAWQRTFTTAEKPTNVYPVYNAQINSTRLIATLEGINGSDWVLWEIDTVVSFSSPHKMSGVLKHEPDAQMPEKVKLSIPNDLRFNTKYYWRAKCINAIDTSDWSSPSYFRTTSEMVLEYPQNGAKNLPFSNQLKWNIQRNSSNLRYQYQIGTDSNFEVLPIISLPAQNGDTTTFSGNFGYTYFWRVRAINDIDTSKWSQTSSFSVMETPIIGLTNLELPKNYTQIFYINYLHLFWSKTANAITYEYEIAEDSVFSEIYVKGKTPHTVFDLQALIFGKRYYWRVRGMNGIAIGPWSEERWFEIMPLVGMKETSRIKGFVMYPNPATDKVTIKADESMLISVLDIQGKTILVQTEKTKETSINTDEWPNGMYIISIETEAGISHQQLIVNH